MSRLMREMILRAVPHERPAPPSLVASTCGMRQDTRPERTVGNGQEQEGLLAEALLGFNEPAPAQSF